jgi:predicted secreted protein
MHRRRTVRLMALAAAVLALALAGGCAAPPATGGGTTGGTTAKTEVTLTEADNGKTVEVAKDGTVVVALKGNPTTGFDWAAEGEVPAILKKEGDNAYEPESTAVGAPSLVTMTYRAVSTGEGELKLAYARSFEPTAKPEQTWSAKIVVK